MPPKAAGVGALGLHHVLCSLMAEKQWAGRVMALENLCDQGKTLQMPVAGVCEQRCGDSSLSCLPQDTQQFLAFSPDGWLGGFLTAGLDPRATLGPPRGFLSCSVSTHNPAAHLPSGPAGLLTWDAYFPHFCPGFLEGILILGWVQGFLGPELTLITWDWNGVS